MSVDNNPTDPAVADDSIDLRPYFLALFRWWRQIAGLIVLAMLVSGIAVALRRPMYEAKVSVAILSYRTTFELEPTMETVTDVGSQRKALVTLAENVTIAENVVMDLGERLPEDFRYVGDLMEMVSAKAQDTDLVEITVRSSDPNVSVMVAQAWAKAYERHINEVYAGAGPYALVALVAQGDAAKRDYQTAQESLIAYTAENPVASLQRMVQEKQATLDARLLARTSSLEEYLSRRVELQRLRQSAASLLAVAREGGSASVESNSMAIAVLKTRALAWMSEEQGSGLTLQVSGSATGGTAQGQIADLQALVAALDGEIAQTVEAIAAASAQGDADSAEETAALEGELRALQAELETAQGRYLELQRDRDLALETYTAVTRKVSEQRVESELTQEIVRVASAPLLPREPVGRSLIATLAIGAAGGLTLGILAVLLITYLFPEMKPGVPWGRRRTNRAEGSGRDPSG